MQTRLCTCGCGQPMHLIEFMVVADGHVFVIRIERWRWWETALLLDNLVKETHGLFTEPMAAFVCGQVFQWHNANPYALGDAHAQKFKQQET